MKTARLLSLFLPAALWTAAFVLSAGAREEPFTPLSADFSDTGLFREGPLDGQGGWRAEQGEAFIEADGEGGACLVLPPGEPHSQASLYFPLPPAGFPLFLDLTVRMGAEEGEAEFLDANGSVSSLLRVDGEGRLLARHTSSAGTGTEDGEAPPEWLDTLVRLPLDQEGVTAEWTRLTVRQDAAVGVWDLYVNGVMRAARLGLEPDARESRGYLTLMGGVSRTLFARRAAVDVKNPLFADTDGDGLPDAWQEGLSLRGREEDPDLDGLTNLEEYLSGTSPRSADTDGDGVTDADELREGTDPLKAEENTRPGEVTAEIWQSAALGVSKAPLTLYEGRRDGFFEQAPSRAVPLNRVELGGFAEEPSALRVRGLIVAPADGEYVFWVSADDSAEFWLSSDDSPFMRRLIARCPSWTGALNFDAFPSQKSPPVRLEAGKRYWFEVLQRNQGGAAHLSAAWQPPGERRSVLSGGRLAAWIPDGRDAKGDGLPDEWQRGRGILALKNREGVPESGPEADPDGDRLPNLEEYRLGSDPLKADAAGRAGLLTREIWFAMPGRYLFDAERAGDFPLHPWWTEYIDSFESPRDIGEDFTVRIRGYVKIPESGTYRFHIAADDAAELWLGESADPFTRRRIAFAPLHTEWRRWDRFPSQTSAPLSLQKGDTLYIEALHKQGGGDSHLSAAWTRPGAKAPEVIGGEHLVSFMPRENDTDGDNLPDDWREALVKRTAEGAGEAAPARLEKRHTAFGDADGDGAVNALEFAAGTDPADPASFPPAGLQWRLWTGIPGTHLDDAAAYPAFPALPSAVRVLTNFDYADQGENYVSQTRGFVTPPVTGEYVFSLAGDGHSRLYLSPDESRFTKRLIAEVPLASAWRHDRGARQQRSAPVRLEAGKKYYIETLHKKGTGRPDHMAAGWTVPGAGQTLILGEFLRPYEPDPLDLDDDGLPDAWERENGLDAEDPSGNNGFLGDPDHDLLTNFDEWCLRTNPREADSHRRRGLARWEAWDGITGRAVERLTSNPRFPARPSRAALLESPDAPQGRNDWHGGRLRGYLAPSVSGEYRLFVSADDQAALYLSASENKFDRKRRVAGVSLWTHDRVYDAREEQRSAPVRLEAGKLYYFELLYKQEDGGDHASLAWLPPGAARPEIPSGDHIAAILTAPEDLDDDELPDEWEKAYGLDPLDAGLVDAANGPWGDPDADTLPNLLEWRLGTNPVRSDSDGDGLSDDFEHHVTGTNAAVKDDLNLTPAAVSAASATVLSGRAEVTEEGALAGMTQTGTLSLPFTLERDGPAFFRLTAGVTPVAAKTPLALWIRADGVSLGAVPLIQSHLPPGMAAGRLPFLLKGTHTLEIGWEVPERDKTMIFGKLEIFQVPADAPPPPAGEGEENPVNTVTSAPVTESLTSPLCLEGAAAWHELVRLHNAGEAKVLPLPDRGWYADVALPGDGSALEIGVSFENGIKSQKVSALWKACNVLESGNLLIRAGDALRLTGHPAGGEGAPPEGTVKLSVDGKETARTAPAEAVEHEFKEPGVYRVTAEFTPAEGGDGEGGAITRTIEVKALRADVPDPVLLYSGQPRTLTLPGLPAEAEVHAAPLLSLTEHFGASPRSFTAASSSKTDLLAALRLPGGGPVLKTLHFSALTLLSDADSYYHTAETLPDGTRIIEMDVFMPRTGPGMRLRVDIIVAGVTFEDGSVSGWITAEDFDENGIFRVRFAVSPGVTTSFCHQLTLFDGDTVLGTR